MRLLPDVVERCTREILAVVDVLVSVLVSVRVCFSIFCWQVFFIAFIGGPSCRQHAQSVNRSMNLIAQ